MTFGDFRGRAKRLDDIDLPAIGHRIGVGEDEIHAVLEVESRGSGFDDKGRPAMLFEPHIFWDQLGNTDKRKEAARLGIAYPRWGEKKYPTDSYPRLAMAMAIDVDAALKSASWGLGQVMGFNFKAAGFTSPQAMVRAFMHDEEAQLSGMINFIKTNRLDDEIRRHDWTGFALGYNGKGFRKHNYHGRLAAAFEKWRKIKDTPWSPEMSAAETEARDPVAPNVVFKPDGSRNSASIEAPKMNPPVESKPPIPVSTIDETPAPPAAEPEVADEKPWWEKSPVLRQLINTVTALGITGAAVLELPPWLIALLAVLVAGVSMYAMWVQSRKV